MISFVKEERVKLLATLVVASFFLYFWIEGPLLQIEPVLNLEDIITEFSDAKMVGDLDKPSTGYGTVEDAEIEGFGHSLIIDKKKDTTKFGLIGGGEGSSALSKEQGDKMLAHARELTGGKHACELVQGPEHFWVNVEGDERQIYMESKDLVHGVHGYAGPINVGVFVNEDGHVTAVHHVSSKETESYLHKVANKGYYDQFTGLKASGDHDLDAVSGATLTTEAVATTATELVNLNTPDPLVNFADVSEMNPFNAVAKLNWWWIVHISVIGLMFLYGMQRKLKKSKRGVLILSALSVGYIGFFLNNSFTYVSFMHPFMGTTVSSLVGLYALMTLLGAIWGKNTYCKYVCPFGNVQRLIMQITPKKARLKFPISNKWIKRLRGGLAIGLITGVLLGLRSWSNFELFPDLFGYEQITLWTGIALFSVVITAVFPMIWCRLLCPTGSVLDFISDAVNFKRNKSTLTTN